MQSRATQQDIAAKLQLSQGLVANVLPDWLQAADATDANIRQAIAKEREKAAVERAAELASVNNVLQNSLQRLSASDGPEAFLDHILTEIARAVQASSLFLFRYDPARHRLALHLSYLDGRLRRGPSGDEFRIFSVPFPADITPAFALMCRDRRFFTPTNTTIPAEEFAWPGVIEDLSRRQPSDVAHVALLVGDTPVGTLGLEFQGGKRLREEDQPFVMALAQQAAIALRLSDLAEQERLAAIAREQEKAAQERADALEQVNATLRESVAKLSQQTDVSAFLAETLGEIVRQMNAANGLILAVDEETRLARLHLFHDGKSARWGMSGAELPLLAAPFSADITPAFAIMCREHQPICASRTPLPIPIEQFALPGAMDYLLRIGASDSAIITLRAGAHVIGTLHLQFVEGVVLREEDEPLFVALSQQAAIALHLTALAEKTKQAAVIEERNRLAREIHDTLAHGFTSIKFLLEAAEVTGALPAEQETLVTQARMLAREGAKEARRSVWALRPEALERGDLLTALSAVMQQRSRETALPMELKVEGEVFTFRSEVEDHLLRVAQEALGNVVKHAQATQVRITLTHAVPAVTLSIRDDGRGFDTRGVAAGTGFGLVGMRERLARLGGGLSVVSVPGTGTEIRAHVPDAH